MSARKIDAQDSRRDESVVVNLAADKADIDVAEIMLRELARQSLEAHDCS
jgi:hypothetical protein